MRRRGGVQERDRRRFQRRCLRVLHAPWILREKTIFRLSAHLWNCAARQCRLCSHRRSPAIRIQQWRLRSRLVHECVIAPERTFTVPAYLAYEFSPREASRLHAFVLFVRAVSGSLPCENTPDAFRSGAACPPSRRSWDAVFGGSRREPRCLRPYRPHSQDRGTDSLS